MLIKNGRMIMDRILKPLQLKSWIRSAPAAAFLGCCALLFGAPLYAQDLLLKEYIYLDGKLLAVERQVLTQAAQQPASDSGKETKFAQYSPSGIHELTPPGRHLQTRNIGNSRHAGDVCISWPGSRPVSLPRQRTKPLRRQ